MCLRLTGPFFKLRVWWVAKGLEIMCCEGGPGRSNVQSATRERRKAEVLGYERHDQCSCSTGLVALLTDDCVRDRRPYAAWTFSMMLNR